MTSGASFNVQPRVLFELGRVSNLPTVWSNALAGYVLGLWIMVDGARDVVMGHGALVLPDSLRDGWALLAGFSLIYLGGMAMNDAMDAPTDARERPSRPIPAGEISRRAATYAVIALLLAGLALLEWHRRTTPGSEPWVLVGGLALVVTVQAYNMLHLHTAGAVVLMAMCRGLVTLTAGVAVYGPPTGSNAWMLPALACAVAGWTLMISLFARGEDVAGPGRKRLVMGLIAGIPVVDALAMSAIGQGWVAAFCLACALLALAGQRRIAGT